MTRRGRFITVEGGEGTGKSTLIAGLETHLLDDGIAVTVTREPGGTQLAEAVRALVLSPPGGHRWSALSEALLVYAARRDHLENIIIPALEAGAWVICDRFADSTRVYQGLGGLDQDSIDTLDKLVVGTSQPDRTLILDGPVQDLLSRRRDRGMSDVFESMPIDFHEKVREAFLDIASRDPERCRVIDAMQAPDDVLKAALSKLHED
ncbi:dTMP kinase [Henriciella marina]|uniref:dTMP kinase n=1 Tax=Henriciella marina TaxID=453851 RepID=UPI00036F27E4|nr:dTMP kinase [Henriciella marina]